MAYIRLVKGEQFTSRNYMIHRRRMVYRHAFVSIAADYGLKEGTIRSIVFGVERQLRIFAFQPIDDVTIALAIGCFDANTQDAIYYRLYGDTFVNKGEADG